MARSNNLDLRKAKILLVDDNPLSLNLLLQVMMGFQAEKVKACGSADEASELVSSQLFDLIIVDGEMPSEDGFSFTRRLRNPSNRQNFTAPVILVSSNTAMEKIIRARDAGANFVVKKPIAPAILLSRIEWLASNRRNFVEADDYRGPDRRFKKLPPPIGISERRADALALTSSPERALSQNDVDSLFG